MGRVEPGAVEVLEGEDAGEGPRCSGGRSGRGASGSPRVSPRALPGSGRSPRPAGRILGSTSMVSPGAHGLPEILLFRTAGSTDAAARDSP